MQDLGDKTHSEVGKEDASTHANTQTHTHTHTVARVGIHSLWASEHGSLYPNRGVLNQRLGVATM